MKTNLPKVAILLAAYNGEKFIQEQIESIINQVDVDAFIYISIDKSNDNTLKICNKLSNENNKVTIINKGLNKFGSAGKNFYSLFEKVDLNSFDFIALSDQDDIWKSSKIIRGIHVLEKENASGYSSDVECFWKKRRKNLIIKKSYPQKKYDFFFEPAGPGCTYILTKELGLSIKEYIKKFNYTLPTHHDWFIYAYARIKNFKWEIDNQPNILYRQHENNQVGANLGIIAFIKRIKKIWNGEYRKEFLEIIHIYSILKNKNYDINSIYKNVIKNPFEYRRNKKDAILLFILFLLRIV